MSVEEDIALSVRSQAEALALRVGGTLVPVLAGKVLKFEEDLDTLPLLEVVCGGPETSVPWQSDDSHRVTYLVRVGLFSAGNRDNATNEGDLATARSQIAGLFRSRAAFPAGTLMVRLANDAPPQIPAAYPQNLDLFVVTGRVTTIEPIEP